MDFLKKIKPAYLIAIVAVVVVVVAGLFFAMKPKGLEGSYASVKNSEDMFTGEKVKDTDTLTFSGDKFKEVTTTVTAGKVTHKDSWSGTFEEKDGDITFYGETNNGQTGTLNKSRKAILMYNGATLVKSDK
ncbi:hypothetical protein [Lacticaseibacillus mingshuiensis]|uniref:Uncharacterized protein n=1 Tax=Lacticaseibacillus mingshuiensis TaxID=2799574 RepID=A0ABW4CE49_9LACO|nr:hypothetical protein [Lacticaseibacillus mingshuiensis]